MSEDEFEAETPLGLRRFVNVVALFGDPATESRLTLACHYDSKRFDSMQFIGASDSAAACAIMLQLARCLNESLHSAAVNGTARSQVSSFTSIIDRSINKNILRALKTDSFYVRQLC